MVFLVVEINERGKTAAIWQGWSAPDAYVGWNATVEAAVKRNADKTLSSRQLSQLLMNFQYRYMLFRAMKLGTPPSVASDALVLLPSGVIETNKHNIDAIVQALRASRMGNIE